MRDVFQQEAYSKDYALHPDLETLEPLSLRLSQTTEMAQRYVDGTMEYDEMTKYLDVQYKREDVESYDCHSFVLSLLKRELRVPVMTAPEFHVPDRNKYKYSSEWEADFVEEMHHKMRSVEWQPYKERLMKFTANIHSNSEHISIPNLPATDFETAGIAAKNIAKQVSKKFLDSPRSRVILISDGRGDEFYDAHSTFILGAEKTGEDLLVLEKLQTGSHMTVKKLSEVIEEYIFNGNFKNLELSICNRPIGELYPEAAYTMAKESEEH